MKNQRLSIFQAFGVELEYMIVDRDTLAVKPIADELLKEVLGEYGGDYENGVVTWSNELVLHVIELKSTRPESDFSQLEKEFIKNIHAINRRLEKWNAQLLPSAAHPFMNPHTETELWPHDNNEVYNIYNKIFDCRGHGWSNLQSTHLNLPFANDDEYGRLHAAIRIVLPLLPGLCASSPLLESKVTDYVDARLTFYKTNQSKIPSIAGEIIPEAVFSEKEHEEVILNKIEKDIAPYNHEGILDPVWVNSRGGMSRFDRGSIEIRIMDIQECPAADLAIVAFVIEILKAQVSEKFQAFENQKLASTSLLAAILTDTIKNGQQNKITDIGYLQLWGIKKTVTVKELCLHLFENLDGESKSSLTSHWPALEILLKSGNLSQRILQRLGNHPNQKSITEVYRTLGNCLSENKLFVP